MPDIFNYVGDTGPQPEPLTAAEYRDALLLLNDPNPEHRPDAQKQAQQKEWARQEGQATRVFPSGASRNSDVGKPDYEGFLCPFVLEAFGKYMTKHRKLEDGFIRASDDWQKGIPQDELMKSLLRHVVALWADHRAGVRSSLTRDTACAILFNVQAYLRGLLT